MVEQGMTEMWVGLSGVLSKKGKIRPLKIKYGQ